MAEALLLKWAWLFLPLILSHVSAESFSVVVPKTPVTGLLGGSVTLPCSLSDNLDARKLEVHWYRPTMYSNPALLYQNEKSISTNLEHQGRVSLVGVLEKGDISLKLDNLRLTDKGAYICHVSSDRWYDKNNVSLVVQAVGSSPILSVVDAGEGKVNVSCHSHGWLPKPSLIWRDSAGNSLEHPNEHTSTNVYEGLFNVSSWLLFSSSESSLLFCSVALPDFIGEMRENRVLFHHVPTYNETWKGAFIATLTLFLLFIIGVGVYCVLQRKGLTGFKGKKTKGREAGTREPHEMEKLLESETAVTHQPVLATVNHDQKPKPGMNSSPSAEEEVEEQQLQEPRSEGACAPNDEENQQLLEPQTADKPESTAANHDQDSQPNLTSSSSAGEHHRQNPQPSKNSAPSAENRPEIHSELSPEPHTAAEVKKFKVNITIDPEETPDFFRIARGGKRVTCPHPKESDEDEKCKIFTLCKEKFSSGQQYWEVKVVDNNKKKLSWFVGVATEEAEREYRIPLTPENGFWVLCYEEENQVYVRDSPTIPTPFDVKTIGVFLDCDNHTLSFYNADTQSHIYTFNNVTLRTSLRPLISPGIRDSRPVHIC